MDQHCNTCAFSYLSKDRESVLSFKKSRQHCNNPKYNSPEYTHEMLMKDWGNGYCCFWAPREERNAA